MKIGIVTTWFERGAAYVSKQYMQTFKNDGHDVKIYARGGESYAKGNSSWDSEDVYWQDSNSFPIYNYVEMKEFKSWIDDNDFDFILFNEQVWFEPIIYCKEIGLKTGAYIDYYTELMIPCFDIYDFVVCNTKKHLKAFKHHKNAIFIPWGTDVKLFDASEVRNSSDNVRFFHSCGMSPHRKGTDLLLKAYLNFSEQELIGTELIIHTQLDSNKLTFGLTKQEMSRYSMLLGKNIIVYDQTLTAPGAYHYGDIYVYPSRLDGLGLTVCEAISCGMPIVVPDDGPMNEFVHSEYDEVVKVDKLFSRYDGYYWPQNEVCSIDLKDKMIKSKDSYKKTPAIHSTIRKLAVDKFDWEKNSAELVDEIVKIKISTFDRDIADKCIKFNEKKFPHIYRFKSVYKIAFYLYKKLK
ncbi:glycosyltransferase family 4 protein [Vibrio splendidus]|uniref:glycosyltransferase family 4 protein n=1 Tax=Vibrio splendidus TaxID=29497 RepID=UPI001BFFF7F9|nr:glycosyltransferase family 4 protein [Vibrio splendidus]MBT9239614.1 glycosyltransferase family 4 protein [Vibrio splendidus]MDP2616110.1 glycosyltransferase family 4 protein [Vibrio splendidus]